MNESSGNEDAVRHSADPAVEHPGVRPDVINADDLIEIVPALKGNKRLTE